jgi:hypothetical protein
MRPITKQGQKHLLLHFRFPIRFLWWLIQLGGTSTSSGCQNGAHLTVRSGPHDFHDKFCLDFLTLKLWADGEQSSDVLFWAVVAKCVPTADGSMKSMDVIFEYSKLTRTGRRLALRLNLCAFVDVNWLKSSGNVLALLYKYMSLNFGQGTLHHCP